MKVATDYGGDDDKGDDGGNNKRHSTISGISSSPFHVRLLVFYKTFLIAYL